MVSAELVGLSPTAAPARSHPSLVLRNPGFHTLPRRSARAIPGYRLALMNVTARRRHPGGISAQFIILLDLLEVQYRDLREVCLKMDPPKLCLNGCNSVQRMRELLRSDCLRRKHIVELAFSMNHLLTKSDDGNKVRDRDFEPRY